MPKQSKWEDAMVKVLSTSKKPLPLHEITKRIIARNLVDYHGDTPQKTLYSIVTRAETRREELGSLVIFIKHKQGTRITYELYDK